MIMEVEMAQDLQIPRVKIQKELIFQFKSKGWGKTNVPIHRQAVGGGLLLCSVQASSDCTRPSLTGRSVHLTQCSGSNVHCIQKHLHDTGRIMFE